MMHMLPLCSTLYFRYLFAFFLKILKWNKISELILLIFSEIMLHVMRSECFCSKNCHIQVSVTHNSHLFSESSNFGRQTSSAFIGAGWHFSGALDKSIITSGKFLRICTKNYLNQLIWRHFSETQHINVHNNNRVSFIVSLHLVQHLSYPAVPLLLA